MGLAVQIFMQKTSLNILIIVLYPRRAIRNFIVSSWTVGTGRLLVGRSPLRAMIEVLSRASERGKIGPVVMALNSLMFCALDVA